MLPIITVTAFPLVRLQRQDSDPDQIVTTESIREGFAFVRPIDLGQRGVTLHIRTVIERPESGDEPAVANLFKRFECGHGLFPFVGGGLKDQASVVQARDKAGPVRFAARGIAVLEPNDLGRRHPQLFADGAFDQ